MPGLVPGIHVFHTATKTWMAGTSPAMTADRRSRCASSLTFRFDHFARVGSDLCRDIPRKQLASNDPRTGVAFRAKSRALGGSHDTSAQCRLDRRLFVPLLR